MELSFQLLSRTKPAQTAGNAVVSDPKSRSKVPTLEEFVKNRDFTGALTLLEVIYKIYLLQNCNILDMDSF